jgi:diketogulonate reductase-like aldo/keto reductase
LLHSPLQTLRDTKRAWQAMETLFDYGGVKQLGISNCYDAEELGALYEWARIKPAVVQNHFYAETGYDADIRALCRRHRIIYQSFWTLTANPHVLSHEITQTLAKKYQRTSAQILFRCLTQLGIVPLSGTTSPIHMRDDLAIFEFKLTDTECNSMNGLFSGDLDTKVAFVGPTRRSEL